MNNRGTETDSEVAVEIKKSKKEKDNVNNMDAHSEFVFQRTYSRWLPDLNRRETYKESVTRYVDFLKETGKDLVPEKVYRKITEFMLSRDVVGSMRLFWTAGKAARATNVAGYNCAFIAMDCVEAFAEMVYVIMCGTGCGFSCENKYISNLPVVQSRSWEVKQIITIPDNKEGWADSVKQLMFALYSGKDVEFDYKLVRPKGSMLHTMGGKSSGPFPLVNTHVFIREIFNGAQGRKLSDLEVHDICCQIAEMVVVGGVRRSALISLSDLESKAMSEAKKGYAFPPRRYSSNNSWVARSKPDPITFMEEWTALAKSGSGERGIINLGAIPKDIKRKKDLVQGVNPCAEIFLRSGQMCNLSEVIIRPNDDIDDLLKKVETATWIGLIQSMLTDFPYLRPFWKENCEEERLLGVSLTGQMDNCPILTEANLAALRRKARKTARAGAKLLGINEPTAITCGKPSGTVSQVFHCGSGCHAWWADYMIRRYRVSASDPIAALLKHHNVPLVPEVGQENLKEPTTLVVEFPLKAPEGAINRHQVTALSQLEHYKKVQTNWCDHNQSVTVYVKPHEWLAVGHWVYTNWDIMAGCAFLPDDGGVYKLAPIEQITKEEYEKRLNAFPKIDYNLLSLFEQVDNTEGHKTLACTGDRCELK